LIYQYFEIITIKVEDRREIPENRKRRLSSSKKEESLLF